MNEAKEITLNNAVYVRKDTIPANKKMCMAISGIMQDAYDSEINVQVKTLWDGGFDIVVGAGTEVASSFNIDGNWSVALLCIMNAIIDHYPDSDFAKKYRDTTISNDTMSIERVQAMCEESLAPEVFEQWESVVQNLKSARRGLI